MLLGMMQLHHRKRMHLWNPPLSINASSVYGTNLHCPESPTALLLIFFSFIGRKARSRLHQECWRIASRYQIDALVSIHYYDAPPVHSSFCLTGFLLFLACCTLPVELHLLLLLRFFGMNYFSVLFLATSWVSQVTRSKIPKRLEKKTNSKC